MSTKTAAFITLGCKINQYETEAIREEVLGLGYREVPPEAPADVYVVNTCSVTRTAGVKSRKRIQRAARANPEARIVVVGCSTASERERLERIPQVALLAGNEEKAQVASFLEGGWKPGEPIPERDRDILDLRVSRYRDRTRATIKVQDGCNNFCSFCVIPHLRGTSRSRHPDAVVEEVRRLVDAGWSEVVVSGVHLQDYGQDFDPPASLAALLDRIAEVGGLRRIRLSSLGVRAFTPELLEVLDRPVFCRHWHIPLQAGSDPVLRSMRRGYGLDEYLEVVAGLRERYEDPAITTDVLVGHPGESDELFEASLEVCRSLAFAKIHVFPFSFREGTLAARALRAGAVDPLEIRRRARILGELDRTAQTAWRRRFLGHELEVLVEGPARDGSDALEGLTERYVRVRFPAPSPFARERFPGTFQQVRAEREHGGGLLGSWAETPAAV